MKRLISSLLVAAFASVSFAQVDISNMTNEELYMKMKGDKVLEQMYFEACNDISKNIELAAKRAQLTDPINTQWTAELTKIADSLGVKITDAAGTPEQHKFYNLNVDTVAVIKFLGLRQAIDSKYQPLIYSATADLNKQYNEMVMASFAQAARKYYENLERMTKE